MTAVATAALLVGTSVASAAPVAASAKHAELTIWRAEDAKCPARPSASAHRGAVLAHHHRDGGCARLQRRVMTVSHVKDATAQPERSGSGWTVLVTFNAHQKREFGRVTAAAVGHELAFVDGDRLITAPTVMEPIRLGMIEITGMTKSEARHLARELMHAR